MTEPRKLTLHEIEMREERMKLIIKEVKSIPNIYMLVIWGTFRRAK